MSWLGSQFEKHHLFRRMAFCAIFVMTWDLTSQSFDLAYAMLDKEKGGQDISLAVGAIVIPAMAIIALVTKIYADGRK